MPKPKFDFEAFLRRAFRQPLDAVAGFLMKLGISPDCVTLFGLAGTIAAACLVASGRLLAGGAVMAVMAPLDAVDGALARKKGVAGKFGAFLDSVVDRYDEMFLLAGVLYHFQSQANTLGVMLHVCRFMRVGFGFLHARAEGLGFSGKTGIFSRIERTIVLILDCWSINCSYPLV